jgi:hypothetical protein
MMKRLQVISTSGNVTRTHLSYLLAWYALSFHVLQVCSCALVSHYPCLTSGILFVHTLRGSLVWIMLVSWACDPP